jgi:hypothetical protein
MSEINHEVSTILQLISDLRGESSVNTDAIRIRAVSEANKDFAKRKFWSFYHLDDQEITGDGSTSYEIGSDTNPYREQGLFDLRVGGLTDTYRYDVTNINNYRQRVSNDASDQVAYVWFDAANDKWMVKINPTVASGTIYYSYYWTPPTLTETTDKVICPSAMIIARLANGLLYEGEDEDDKARDNYGIAEQLIDEVIGIDNAPAVNELLQFGAIENADRTRGIGSY